MKLHTTMPSGFDYADRLQVIEFERTGFITGATKVANVRAHDETRVACRLRPPRTIEEVRSNLGRRDALKFGAGAPLAFYVAQYNRGWAAGRRGASAEFSTGYTDFAYDDGYLDASAQRMKWHLTYCSDHDECGEG